MEGADLVVVGTPIPAIATWSSRALGRDARRGRDGRRERQGLVVAGRSAERAAPDARAATCPDTRWAAASAPGPITRPPRWSTASCGSLTPTDGSDHERVDTLESWIAGLGAGPVRMPPARHDRLVAFVSHLPQVASTALMGLAATEEADEPEILLLAAGGFRDLTGWQPPTRRCGARSCSRNRDAIAEAIDLYVARLERLRDQSWASAASDVRRRSRRPRLPGSVWRRSRRCSPGWPCSRSSCPTAPAPSPTSRRPSGRAGQHRGPPDRPLAGRRPGTVHLTVAADAAGHADRGARRRPGLDPDQAGLRSTVRVRVTPGSDVGGDAACAGRQVDRSSLADPGRDGERA